MSKPKPRVFNIPASAPFLPELVRALMAGRLIDDFPGTDGALALANATIYLPTRRACRQLRESFLAVTGTPAAILPRIVAVGDIDEDELIFADASGPLAADAFELPPELGGLERQLLLSRLIMAWAKSAAMRGAEDSPLVANTPASALALAGDLARLMDDMTTRQVSWDRLDGLVPDALDDYWQRSLDFLKIARATWPKILKERGVIEPAMRRDRLIEAETRRLARSTAPAIAAGSTGSMPSTAQLLATIARLPHGAVVLPGLDTTLDDESWTTISGNAKARPHDGGTPAAGHPQFAMQALLTRIGMPRADVMQLKPGAPRDDFVAEALRPAATTDRWQSRTGNSGFSTAADNALANIVVIEAANIEDEALAIAVALRETVETPDTTAALVTPDRALARRVLAALERWNIAAYDSGGDALSDMPAGIFARLAAQVAIAGLEPVPLLALLKHPLFRLGEDDGHWPRAISALERAVLRGPRPKPGRAALCHALGTFRAELAKFRSGGPSEFHRSDPRTSIADADLDAAARLAAALASALAPLEAAVNKSRDLRSFAALHGAAIVALSRSASGAPAALSGADGQVLERLLAELAESDAAASFAIESADYPELIQSIMASATVRRAERPGARIRIYGLLESRLQSHDRVVLGGLNEGVWPPDIRSDPWLSRPMRQSLGLDLPERRIGLAAHDFTQGLGAENILLTRSAKIAGAPAVMSRFVQRLAALAGPKRWDDLRARGDDYLTWAHQLDTPSSVVPAKRPEPRPPLDARPLRMSVTDIENWLRDPYTIYAKHILRLTPFDAVDTAPGATERGSFIHAAIGEYTQTFARGLPADPCGELLKLGEMHFAPFADVAEARALWWPRFRRVARWFAEWDVARRSGIAAVFGEINGSLSIPLGARTFTLSARADRIEKMNDGSYVVVDYKTGEHRTEPQVRTGLAPQLTLEAAILRRGGFRGVAAGPVGELMYVTLKGGEPAGREHPVKFKEKTTDEQAEFALARLTEVALAFENVTMPYRALVSPMWKTRYGDYDHLARVKEWSASGGAGGDGE